MATRSRRSRRTLKTGSRACWSGLSAEVRRSFESPACWILAKSSARSDEEMKKMEQSAKKAVGYSEERGDQVQVINVAFNTSAEEGAGQGSEAPMPNPMMGQSVRYGLFGLLAMLIVLFIVRPVIRLLSTPSLPQ